MPYCEYCGNELSPIAAACPRCGHPQRAMAFTLGARLDNFELAGYWRRVGASLIDSFLLSAVTFGIIVAFAVSTTPSDSAELEASGPFLAAIALSALAVGLYRTLMEGSRRGQTLGKMALGISVRDERSVESIGYGRAFIRWLVAYGAWILFYVPGVVDLLFPLWDKRNQTLHDKAARSVVIDLRATQKGKV